VAARGIGGDPEPEPSLWSAWVASDPWGPLTGFARFDLVQWTDGDPTSRTTTSRVGLGTHRPFTRAGPGRLVAGWTHRTAGDQAAPVAGAPAAADDDTFWIQLDVHLRGALPLGIPGAGEAE